MRFLRTLPRGIRLRLQTSTSRSRQRPQQQPRGPPKDPNNPIPESQETHTTQQADPGPPKHRPSTQTPPANLHKPAPANILGCNNGVPARPPTTDSWQSGTKVPPTIGRGIIENTAPNLKTGPQILHGRIPRVPPTHGSMHSENLQRPTPGKMPATIPQQPSSGPPRTPPWHPSPEGRQGEAARGTSNSGREVTIDRVGGRRLEEVA